MVCDFEIIKCNKVKQKQIQRMNLTPKHKICNTMNQLLSTDFLTPHSEIFLQSFHTQINTDPIYYVPSEVKRKKMKQSQRSIKNKELEYSSCKNENVQLRDAYFSSSLKQNKTVFANYSKTLKPQFGGKTQNPIENQRKKLYKITIHRIRSQRQNIQSQTKKIQNSYNYLSHKIEKEKRRSLETAHRNQKNKEIQVQSKKQKVFLSQQKSLFQQQNSLQKSRLRQSVIHQKKKKQKTIHDFYNNLQANASQTRFQLNEIEQQIMKTQLNELQCNKKKYLIEKEKQKIRLQKRQKSLQDKRLSAHIHFKNKWLKQFNQTSKAQRAYLSKREILNKKMQRLYKKLNAQSCLEREQKNKQQKPKIEWMGLIGCDRR